MSFEKKYLRKSLGLVCFSSQIAYSFLEGRVSKNELFVIDHVEISFEELCVQDELVREIIHRPDNFSPSPAKQFKFDSFSARFNLFKKIVLRGDDSLTSLIFESDEQKKEIINLHKKIHSLEDQLFAYKNKNDALVCLSTNTYQSLQELKVITSCMNPERDSNEIIGELIADIGDKIQKNSDIIISQEFPQRTDVIKNISVIENFREKIEKKLQDRKNEFEEKVRNAKKDLKDLSHKLNQRISAVDRYEKRFRHHIKIIKEFEQLEQSKRFYLVPDIPRNLLYVAIEQCFDECAPNMVLAIFDCSQKIDCSKGVLVSTRSFYLFNDSTCMRFYFCSENQIFFEEKKSTWMEQLNPWRYHHITLKCKEKEMMFSLRSTAANELKQFCIGINNLCNLCTFPEEHIAQIYNLFLDV